MNAPNIAPQRKTYDAIVVGSGITGGWAAKEFTERGLDTLVLERGRNVTHGEDYITEHKPSWEMDFHGQGNKQEFEEHYPRQSMAGPFNAYNKHFFVKDSKYPYTFDEEEPFLWVRGYHLGGRSITWGRADCQDRRVTVNGDMPVLQPRTAASSLSSMLVLSMRLC